MNSLIRVKQQMLADPANWILLLMNFVDDFRYYKDELAIREPFTLDNERIDAVLASTVEYLCDELKLEPPRWLESVPSCQVPYFVSGVEALKSFTIVESPLRFRMRKIFVLENFLVRV